MHMWCMCVVGIRVQTLWYINLCQLHSGKEAVSKAVSATNTQTM